MQLQQLIELSPIEIETYVKKHETTIIDDMLQQIGAVDSYTREAVTYQLFAFCMQQQIFSDEAKQNIIQTLVERQLLLERIDEQSDAVFIRSASALWLTQLVKYDDNGLSEEQYEMLFQQAIDALRLERDGRGFINEQQGWADAIGVKADLCLALLQHPHFSFRYTSKLLQAITSSLWNEHVFINNEDERFIKIIIAFIQKSVDEALLIEWVEQLFDRLEYYSYEVGYTQQWFIARTNLLQLMKTQYFHLKFSHQYEQLRATTSIFIQKWLKLS